MIIMNCDKQDYWGAVMVMLDNHSIVSWRGTDQKVLWAIYALVE